jgi:hypothetical protein
MVLVLASCSINRKKREKRERSYHGGNPEFSIKQNAMVSTLKYVLLFTINKALSGGSPRFTILILMLISPLNMA